MMSADIKLRIYNQIICISADGILNGIRFEIIRDKGIIAGTVKL